MFTVGVGCLGVLMVSSGANCSPFLVPFTGRAWVTVPRVHTAGLDLGLAVDVQGTVLATGTLWSKHGF